MAQEISASQIFREMSSPEMLPRNISKEEREEGKSPLRRSNADVKELIDKKQLILQEGCFWIHLSSTINGLLDFGSGNTQSVNCDYIRIDADKRHVMIYATNFYVARPNYHGNYKFYTGEAKNLKIKCADVSIEHVEILKSLGTIYKNKETVHCKPGTLYYRDRLAEIGEKKKVILEVKTLEFEEITKDRFFLVTIKTGKQDFEYPFEEFSFVDVNGKDTIEINPRRVTKDIINKFR